MKFIITSLLLVCLHSIALSQEHTATFGKNPTCNRQGGICTMQSGGSSSKNASAKNVSIIQTKDGATILRIHREHLTQDEEDHIFGVPIVADTKNSLQFTIHEAIALPSEIVTETAITKSRQVQQLEAKTYSTIISDLYIDITIVEQGKD